MAGNIYFVLQNVFKSQTVSRASNIIIFKTLLRQVVNYRSKIWIITTREENMVKGWERKIYKPVIENGVREQGKIMTNRL